MPLDALPASNAHQYLGRGYHGTTLDEEVFDCEASDCGLTVRS